EVASEIGAVTPEQLRLVPPEVEVDRVVVRVVGVLRGDPECHALAAARDPDGDAAVLQRQRSANRALDLVVLAVQGRDAVRPRLPEDLDPLAEPTEALLDAREAVAVRAELVLVPSAADAHLEATARDVVDRRGDLREVRGIAIRHARA